MSADHPFPALAHVFLDSGQPELFLDPNDGEYSIYVPAGDGRFEVLSDLVACSSADPVVQALGNAAANLNSQPMKHTGGVEEGP